MGQTEAWLGSKVKALEACQTHTTAVLVTESIAPRALGDLDEELCVRQNSLCVRQNSSPLVHTSCIIPSPRARVGIVNIMGWHPCYYVKWHT